MAVHVKILQSKPGELGFHILTQIVDSLLCYPRHEKLHDEIEHRCSSIEGCQYEKYANNIWEID